MLKVETRPPLLLVRLHSASLRNLRRKYRNQSTEHYVTSDHLCRHAPSSGLSLGNNVSEAQRRKGNHTVIDHRLKVELEISSGESALSKPKEQGRKPQCQPNRPRCPHPRTLAEIAGDPPQKEENTKYRIPPVPVLEDVQVVLIFCTSF